MEYPIIEGKARSRDFSNEFLQRFSELASLEQGIPYKEFYFHSRTRDKTNEFRFLKKITETAQHGSMLTTSEALSDLNRYRDILPYRDTIVSLEGEYINASIIDGSCEGTVGMFIATQGPIKSSVVHMWKMVWNYKVSLIVMLCNFIENDFLKCDKYFSPEETLTCGEFEITVLSTKEVYPCLYERAISVKRDTEQRTITHIHATNWPDQTAPSITENFNAINYVISKIKMHSTNGSKVTVHCSAGIGRTGILIGIYNIVSALEELILKADDDKIRLSVFGTIRRLREQRWGMVNNLKQYKFLYKFMEYWLSAYFTYQKELL